MKNHIIDNSIKNLGKTVLWQYDKAVRLLAILKHLQVTYYCAVEQFWAYWMNKVLALDTCGAFGCSVWGIFLGVPRPVVKDSKDDENSATHLVATSVYRRVLKSRFYLLKANASFESIHGYLEILFGLDGNDALSKWSAKVSEYGWTTNINEINGLYASGVAYAAGYVFWYDYKNDGVGANWICETAVTADENTSFEAIKNHLLTTSSPTTYSQTHETIMLKLYDPEGNLRKVTESPSNSLSILLTYDFGGTTITVSASRRRKCGISIEDAGDMTLVYKKSPYYEQMHKDQKALFEQRLEEFCLYPLGVGDGHKVERWVFGFSEPTYRGKNWKVLGTDVINAGDAFMATVGGVDKIYISKYGGLQTVKQFTQYNVIEIGNVVDTIQQDVIMYQSGKAYEKGDEFAYIDGNGHGYTYSASEDISAKKNTSFNAIAQSLNSVSDYFPLGGLAEGEVNYPKPGVERLITSQTPWGDYTSWFISQLEANLPNVYIGNPYGLINLVYFYWGRQFKAGQVIRGKKNGMPVLYELSAPKASGSLMENNWHFTWTEGSLDWSSIYGEDVARYVLVTKEMCVPEFYKGTFSSPRSYRNQLYLPPTSMMTLAVQWKMFRIQEALDEISDKYGTELGWKVVKSTTNNRLTQNSDASFLK